MDVCTLENMPTQNIAESVMKTQAVARLFVANFLRFQGISFHAGRYIRHIEAVGQSALLQTLHCGQHGLT